jgi:DNA-binding transcriptional LysR family regulator
MERVRRLNQLWSWLPAFRAVAETEHLPTASRQLNVAPSALSRTIRLLEEDLGRPLFNRVGRRLQLNDDGDHFLSAVRDAMRSIDDGLNVLAAAERAGPVRIAAISPLIPGLVLPALEQACALHPGLQPLLVPLVQQEVNAALRDGTLDLALTHQHDPHRDLVAERLTSVTYAVFCGPGHPLVRARNLTVERLLAHPFVTYRGGDPWPPDLKRVVALHVTEFREAVEICAQGGHLAVLPTEAGKVHRDPRVLRALPLKLGDPRPVYAVTRRPLGVRGRTEVALEALRQQAGGQRNAGTRHSL